VQESPPS
jgi:hypothetical protein